MRLSNVVFEDPAHRIEGSDALLEYFVNLFENVEQCEFEIHNQHQSDNTGFIVWTMLLRHPKLNRSKQVQVDGVSQIAFKDAKVSYHRDYFDLGSMLYEQLPVLGAVVKKIKAGLGR